ncbi:protein tyrosine phosphatase [Leucobacter luti]|nr:protein tyrosine phosphatase [Leucobacter luti]
MLTLIRIHSLVNPCGKTRGPRPDPITSRLGIRKKRGWETLLAHRRQIRHTGHVTAPYRISFICTGNICRSPMGEVVLRQLIADAGLADRFEVTSRGTGGWHQGDPADPRTLAALAARGYNGAAHRAAQLTDADIRDHDLLIALARDHERALLDRGADPDRVALLTTWDPDQPSDPDVFDPYYSDADAFDTVLTQVERSAAAVLEQLRASRRH